MFVLIVISKIQVLLIARLIDFSFLKKPRVDKGLYFIWEYDYNVSGNMIGTIQVSLETGDIIYNGKRGKKSKVRKALAVPKILSEKFLQKIL